MMSACHKLQHHEAEGFIRAHDRPRGNARGWRPRSEWGDNRARCAPIAERSEFQPDDPVFRLDQTRPMGIGTYPFRAIAGSRKGRGVSSSIRGRRADEMIE